MVDFIKILKLKWIFGPADLEVDMDASWSVNLTGITHISNYLALNYRLTNGHDIATIVSIKSLSAVIVLDNHIIAVTAIPSAALTNDDLPGGGGHNRRPQARRQIYAVITVQTLGPDAARDWPHIITNIGRAAGTLYSGCGCLASATAYRFLFAAWYNHHLALGQGARGVEIVELDNLLDITPVLLRQTLNRITSRNNMPNAGNRQDKKHLARLDSRAALQIISPKDGVDGNAEHLADLG